MNSFKFKDHPIENSSFNLKFTKQYENQQYEEHIRRLRFLDYAAVRGATELYLTPKDFRLLNFSFIVSKHYYSFLKSYCRYEIVNNIDLLPLNIGILKKYGLTSEDIINLSEQINQLFIYLKDFNKIINLLKSSNSKINLLKIKKEQINLDIELILKFYLLISKFGHEDDEYILDKISCLYDFYLKKNNNQKNQFNSKLCKKIDEIIYNKQDYRQRLISEIRFRITGEGKIQTCYGNLGTNPLLWINLLEKISHETKSSVEMLCEFRNRLYFVYMMNHLCNEIIENNKLLLFINKENNNIIDINFIKYLRDRKKQELSHIPPLFRYGAYSSLNNKGLRKISSNFNNDKKNSSLKITSFHSAMNQEQKDNPYLLFNSKLSEKELYAHTGNLYNKEKFYPKGTGTIDYPETPSPIKYPTCKIPLSSGSTLFEVSTNQDNTYNTHVNAYIDHVNKFFIPSTSGISGTLDQSFTMAALVKVGINPDLTSNIEELQTIKLAYIVFMCSTNEHSLHEILYSSKSFGVPYITNQNMIDYIYPIDPEYKEYVLKILNNIPEYNNATNYQNIKKEYNQKVKNVYSKIVNCKAIARTSNYKHFNYEIEKLKYPSHVRPIANIDLKDRKYIYNYKYKKLETRVISNIRGAQKDTDFTKKTSVTLLNPKGNNTLFTGNTFSLVKRNTFNNNYIFLIYDLDKVNTKSFKYVFYKNAVTDSRSWIGEQSRYEDPNNDKYYTSIYSLKLDLILNSIEKKYSLQNELLVGLSADALIGISVIDDSQYSINYVILDLLILQTLIRKELNLTLPLFKLNTNEPYSKNSNLKLLSKNSIIEIFKEYINISKNPILFEIKNKLKILFKLLYGYEIAIKKDEDINNNFILVMNRIYCFTNFPEEIENFHENIIKKTQLPNNYKLILNEYINLIIFSLNKSYQHGKNILFFHSLNTQKNRANEIINTIKINNNFSEIKNIIKKFIDDDNMGKYSFHSLKYKFICNLVSNCGLYKAEIKTDLMLEIRNAFLRVNTEINKYNDLEAKRSLKLVFELISDYFIIDILKYYENSIINILKSQNN